MASAAAPQSASSPSAATSLSSPNNSVVVNSNGTIGLSRKRRPSDNDVMMDDRPVDMTSHHLHHHRDHHHSNNSDTKSSGSTNSDSGSDDLVMDECSAAMVLISLSCSPKSPGYFHFNRNDLHNLNPGESDDHSLPDSINSTIPSSS